MEQTRRGIITGLVALVAAPAVIRVADLMPISVPRIPMLWGDGVHDDTEALQALFDGLPVKPDDMRIVTYASEHGVDLINGYFRVTKSLFVRKPNTRIMNCIFEGSGMTEGYLLNVKESGAFMANIGVFDAPGGIRDDSFLGSFYASHDA